MHSQPTLILVVLLLTGSAFAAPPAPAPAPAGSGGSGEEVLKPTPFSKQEQQVIRSLQTLKTERIVELLRVYEKLNNEAMLEVLSREVLKRNPTNPDALRVSSQLSPEIEVRPVGYLDKLVTQLQSGQKVEDPEGIATVAHSYVQDQRPADAIRLLQKLRDVNYPKLDFPYLDDLASAYHDNGQLAEAEKAWKEVLDSPPGVKGSLPEAEQGLATIDLEKRISAIRAKAATDPESGIDPSAALLNEMPEEPLAISFRVESLNRAGRYSESVSYLKELEKKSPRRSFAFRDELGDSLFLSKDYKAARANFQSILDDPNAEADDKADAKKMLGSISIAEKVDEGQKALLKDDVAQAKATLIELDQLYPNSDDTLDYRAQVLLKTGASKEALEMLTDMKDMAAIKKQPFMHLDTLGDVYLDRKEYALARQSYQEILSNPLYDEEARRDAAKGMIAVGRERLFDMANDALDKGQRAKAKEYADALLADTPNDPEVLVLEADVMLAYGQVQEAIDEYKRLKARYYAGMHFPGQPGLASALEQNGQRAESLAALEEITPGRSYEPEEVWSARWDQRELLPELKFHISDRFSYVDEAEGELYKTSGAFSTPWLNDWRLLTKTTNTNISLVKSETILKDLDTHHFEGQVSLQRRIQGNTFAEVTVGGSENDVIYGARMASESPRLSWSLGFSGNARAEDSLSLMALDGREDRVDFSLEGIAGSRVRYGLSAYAKRIKVGGDNIGDGYGVSGNLDYILLQETMKSPEITIGYYGEYMRFKSEDSVPSSVKTEIRRAESKDEVRAALPVSADLKKALPYNYGREIFDSLVDPESHRQGIELTLRKHLDLQWNFYAQVGTYYEVDEGSLEYTAALGIEYWLNDNAMLYAELRYDSSGKATNSGESIVEANLGAEISF